MTKTIEELQDDRRYALGEFLHAVATRDYHTREAAQAYLTIIEWAHAMEDIDKALMVARGEPS